MAKARDKSFVFVIALNFKVEVLHLEPAVGPKIVKVDLVHASETRRPASGVAGVIVNAIADLRAAAAEVLAILNVPAGGFNESAFRRKANARSVQMCLNIGARSRSI